VEGATPEQLGAEANPTDTLDTPSVAETAEGASSVEASDPPTDHASG